MKCQWKSLSSDLPAEVLLLPLPQVQEKWAPGADVGGLPKAGGAEVTRAGWARGWADTAQGDLSSQRGWTPTPLIWIFVLDNQYGFLIGTPVKQMENLFLLLAA